jgi:hypothetical protein
MITAFVASPNWPEMPSKSDLQKIRQGLWYTGFKEDVETLNSAGQTGMFFEWPSDMSVTEREHFFNYLISLGYKIRSKPHLDSGRDRLFVSWGSD